MYSSRHITVVIPALNEELSIARVVDGLFNLRVCQLCSKAFASGSPGTHTDSIICQCEHAATTANDPLLDHAVSNPSASYNSVLQIQDRLVDRIIVCDNGSTDNTASLAEQHGAVVVQEAEAGYGAACLAALAAVQAAPVEKDIIVFVDGDHSVVATELPALVNPILDGADMVIGSRTLGNTQRGALSVPQQFGNALASFLIRSLWSADVTDLGPFRAITQTALTDLQMSDRQFGWTVEMQVRAIQESKTTVEVPVTTLRRIGESKISGTVRGVVGAAHGILGTIAKLYWAGLTKSSTPRVSPSRN